MKTKHEYGNKPEGYSELEEEIAEDAKFKNDNKNAIAAFLNEQHHDVVPGNATSDGVQAEPPVEGVLHTDIIDHRDAFRNLETAHLHSVVLHTDIIERRKAAITDRRNLAKK